jgi:hypothetical protein
VSAARIVLSVGLVTSGALVAVVGGTWGIAFGVAQVAAGVGVGVWRRSRDPLVAGLVSLVAPVLVTARHWSAGVPGVCHCARLPHPAPALVSTTGLAVLLDVVLVGLTVAVLAANRQVEVGNSSP